MYEPPIPSTSTRSTSLASRSPAADDPLQQRAVFVHQPLGQVEEGGVQRLHLFRHRHAALVHRQVVEHFLPRGGQPRGQPLQVGLDQARLPHKRRGVLGGNQRGIVVGDGGQGFHGRDRGVRGIRNEEVELKRGHKRQ